MNKPNRLCEKVCEAVWEATFFKMWEELYINYWPYRFEDIASPFSEITYKDKVIGSILRN